MVGLFAAGLIAAFVQAQGQVPQQVANPAAVINGTGTATRAAARPRGGNRYTTRSAPATRPANPSDLTPPRPFNPAQGVAELPSVLKRKGPPATALPPSQPYSIGDTEPLEVAERPRASALGAPGIEDSYTAPSAAVDEDVTEATIEEETAGEETGVVVGIEDDEAYADEGGLAPPETQPVDSPYGDATEAAPEAEPYSATTEFAPRAFGAPTMANSYANDPSDGSNGVQVSSRMPNVRVDISGPGAIIAGKPAMYRLWVVNDGADAARNIRVHVAVPARVQVASNKSTAGQVARGDDGRVSWSIPQLAGGGDEELSLILLPQDPQSFDVAIEWSAEPAASLARIDVQQPQLAVEVSGPNEILFGDRQLYTITISNPGTGPAENVVLDVTTGGGSQSKRMGTIPAGGREQVRMELIAREAGQLEIQAVATGDGELRSEARQQILVRRAQLAVQLVAPRLKFAGSTGIYEVQVTNTGNAPATDVEVSLRKPASLQYVGGVEGAAETGGRVAWRVAQLEPGEEQIFQVEMAYHEAGAITCEAVASSGELAASDQGETRVEAIADLKLVVNDPESPKAVGDEVVYEIRVLNHGTKDSGPVNVIGQFSEGIEPVRAEGAQADVVPGQVIFHEVPRVAAGKAVTLKIVARAEKPGNHRFRAVLKATDPETELIAEDMTRFFGEELRTATSGASKRK